MVSAGISAFIMAGVMSSFLMMGRTGANMRNYTELEGQARRALELFSRECIPAATAKEPIGSNFERGVGLVSLCFVPGILLGGMESGRSITRIWGGTR